MHWFWLLLPWVLASGLLARVLVVQRSRDQARRAHARAMGQLNQSNLTLNRISQAVESASDAIGIGDMEANSVYHNRAHVALFGYTVDELNAVEEPAALFADKAVAATIHASVRAGRSWSGETDIKTKDGRHIPAFVRADIIRDDNGRPVGIFGVFRDITQERSRAAERERADRLESLGLLAGGIAHDFANLLTVIMGNLSLVQLNEHLPAPDATRLGEVERAAWRAKDLTHQLLTFAKGGEPEMKRVELAAILRESLVFALHGATQVSASENVAPGLWPVEADEGQLGQVFNNLALNAVQAMDGRGTLLVAAENLVTGPEQSTFPAGVRLVHVRITDNGPGIPPGSLAKIFDPFFTTKATGTGLGLATVYSIIKKHEGLISVESTVGTGTTFHVFLRAAAAVI
jgi:PAS domain S-box-containing protein